MCHCETQRADFQEHDTRMQTQYEQIRRLKQNLSKKHVLIHMEFAEIYSCKTLDKIQSIYWCQTLHPIVLYYRTSEDESILHQSYVIVSDTLSHNSTAVLAFLDAIMPDI